MIVFLFFCVFDGFFVAMESEERRLMDGWLWCGIVLLSRLCETMSFLGVGIVGVVNRGVQSSLDMSLNLA